jgi:hypothetical protein
MMRGFSGKRFYAANVVARPERHYAGCVILCLIAAGLFAATLYMRMYPVTQSAPQAAPTAQATPEAGQKPLATATALPTATPSEDDAPSGVIGTVQHVWVNDNERAAVAKVYPTSAPIPAGVDPACYYADKYGVSCADVKSAVDEMLRWRKEDGRDSGD